VQAKDAADQVYVELHSLPASVLPEDALVDGSVPLFDVHGDNLAAMTAMLPERAGQFRAIYIDPPFNTGRAFAEYDDARSTHEWASFMRPRLALARELLADDGALFAEIDDTELATLTLLLDEVFGRESRVSTVTVVRSAPTGHKAINAGPVNVTDYLLVYAKDRAKLRLAPQLRVRRTYDDAYKTWIDNPGDPPAAWRFRPIARAVAEHLGHDGPAAARRALGGPEFAAFTRRFAVEHAPHVVRFAQPRYEAISQKARALVDRSRAEPDRVFVLRRGALPDFVVRGGNRVLFLAKKVRVIGGVPTLVEPLTNVWDDVPFQGIAREGGVAFVRNKKPERLLARVLAMATEPGDWVLDPFAGSGTTAAVALKMGRRFVAIEEGAHAFTLAEPRLARVVRGEDPTGITTEVGFAGGGGFRVVDA
jgi:adenine-specific DNA-methyltransferase